MTAGPGLHSSWAAPVLGGPLASSVFNLLALLNLVGRRPDNGRPTVLSIGHHRSPEHLPRPGLHAGTMTAGPGLRSTWARPQSRGAG